METRSHWERVYATRGPDSVSWFTVIRYEPGGLHGQSGNRFDLLDQLTEAHPTPTGAVQQFMCCRCVPH